MNTFDKATIDGVRKYIKDTAGQAMIAVEETSTTATTAHAINSLFRLDGKLYKTTSAIAIGDTIVYEGNGANCVETNVEGELVKDIQINGTSILNNGVANIPIADGDNLGVVKRGGDWGITIDSQGRLAINGAGEGHIKASNSGYRPITASFAHYAAFYGLAKAAGADMKDIANTTVGTYPDAQKEAIQSMLGITQMLAPENPNLVASQAYAIGDVFAANGHLYKATAAIAQDGTIIPDTNCVETTMADAGGKIKDVQVAGTSVVENGIANVPTANSSTFGVIKIGGGLTGNNGVLSLYETSDGFYKSGFQANAVIINKQHLSTFYGLSKAAGVDLANETVTLGTYPETSKTAIRSMIGATSSNVISVQGTQPTDPDTKIWIDDDASGSVQVPTVSEMESALATKVSDVQVNGVSVVSEGVADVPIASTSSFGVVKIATGAQIGVGSSSNNPIAPSLQHISTFFGLAKAANADMTGLSYNNVGQYTDAAKTAIKNMIGVEEGLKVVRLI